jgi:hypothetical protein
MVLSASSTVRFLEGLQPKPEIVRLFKKIVLDVWEQKRLEATADCAVFEKQIKDFKGRKVKLFDAYSGGVLSLDEYKEMKAELDKKLMRAEIDANDTRLKEGDLEGLQDFAESILLDISAFWLRCSVDQKQRLQHTLFPEGLRFADGTYRTSATCLLFNLLQPNEDKKEDLVALTGIEPVF